jgi:hypothetical protein
VRIFNSNSLLVYADQSNFIRAFGQGHGLAQVVALIALEVITAVSKCTTNAAA